MKTLVVLSALAAIATAGPTIPGDDITDFDVTKIGKRSPTLDFHKHHISAPVHHLPVVHHTYVQPVISHHLGLKKPLLFNQHHGHHHYRDGDEVAEIHSAESKETKTKCMKEMEAKCDDEVIAKSSELTDVDQIEDIEDSVSEDEVAESLQMAKEAVNTLQRKLQKAEKNPRMTQWKQGELESDVKLQREVETAKQALDQMQLNFGNLESMNVHATTFKDAEVKNIHMELTNSEQERIAQWKDAIENIQKNVELVKNIEDSFQQTENAELKSATLENSSTHKQGKTEDQKSSMVVPAHKEASEMRTDGKSEDTKSSWKALQIEKSANIDPSSLKSDMESSASSLSESSTALHSTNEHHEPSARSEHVQSLLKSHNQGHSHHSGQTSTQAQTHHGAVSLNAKQIPVGHGHIKKSRDDEHSLMIAEDKMNDKQMGTASQLVKTMKSSEGVDSDLSHFENEKSVPVVDTTTLMKSANEHVQAVLIANKETLEKSSLKTDGALSPSQLEGSALKHEEKESKFMENARSSPFVNSNAITEDSALKNKQIDLMEHAKSSQFDNSDAFEGKPVDSSLSSNVQGKSVQNEMIMKSSDQMTGQSQQSEVATMAVQHTPSGLQVEKSRHLNSFGVHGKSDDGVSDSALLQASQNGLHAGFKSSLDAPKSMSWKSSSLHGSARSSYGSGLSLGSGYGASSYGAGAGAGAGSGAVGVFPSAHVGGCAIPLLLSCSPSVVAGHLAKSHSSYAAPSYSSPSYRNTETNTHSKRDITKIATPTKIKRTPIRNLKQKSILIADRM